MSTLRAWWDAYFAVVTGPDFLSLLAVLGAVYCLGGLHGLRMAWDQEYRMRRWAHAYVELLERIEPSFPPLEESCPSTSGSSSPLWPTAGAAGSVFATQESSGTGGVSLRGTSAARPTPSPISNPNPRAEVA